MVLLSCRCKFKPYTNGFEFTSLSLTHVSEKFTSLSHPSQETILLPLMMIEVGCGHLSVGHSPTEDAEELTDQRRRIYLFRDNFRGVQLASALALFPWRRRMVFRLLQQQPAVICVPALSPAAPTLSP